MVGESDQDMEKKRVTLDPSFPAHKQQDPGAMEITKSDGVVATIEMEDQGDSGIEETQATLSKKEEIMYRISRDHTSNVNFSHKKAKETTPTRTLPEIPSEERNGRAESSEKHPSYDHCSMPEKRSSDIPEIVVSVPEASMEGYNKGLKITAESSDKSHSKSSAPPSPALSDTRPVSMETSRPQTPLSRQGSPQPVKVLAIT